MVFSSKKNGNFSEYIPAPIKHIVKTMAMKMDISLIIMVLFGMMMMAALIHLCLSVWRLFCIPEREEYHIDDMMHWPRAVEGKYSL